MTTGYCTLDDVRRALQKANLPGDLDQDNRLAVDAIVSQSEWVERTYKRHWYAPDGADILDEATEIDIPTAPKTREDEEDIRTTGASVIGSADDRVNTIPPSLPGGRQRNREPDPRIKLAFGDRHDEDIPTYTRIRLDRKDVESINELHVVNEDGGFDDWVASDDYEGGVGNQHRGEDYWGRVNNDGVSELYLNVHSLDDDIASLSKAVYVDFDYGREGISRTARRAVALFAAAEFVEDLAVQVPENARVYNVETKADELRERAEKMLEPDSVEP